MTILLDSKRIDLVLISLEQTIESKKNLQQIREDIQQQASVFNSLDLTSEQLYVLYKDLKVYSNDKDDIVLCNLISDVKTELNEMYTIHLIDQYHTKDKSND